MNKVAIIGCCGSGKTVLAKRLGQKAGLPVHNLDDLFWHEGWVQTKPDKWREIHSELIKGDIWIIDGTYSNLLEERVKLADTIIWIDMPSWFCVYRVMRRALFTYIGIEKALPKRIQGAHNFRKHKILSDWGFIKYTYDFNKKINPTIEKVIVECCTGKDVVRLRSVGEIKRYLKYLG